MPGYETAGPTRAAACREDPAEQKHRPFCSKRCANIDLGRWLKESYRVPTDQPPVDGDEPPDRPTGQGR
ncbi:MAG: DNA gyrase inhibitor YacG [Alphaproteobacteria bacterium]|nr:MAG: DNA gyrase inhibitor YacG [Alphaproteobacteria bacterium]